MPRRRTIEEKYVLYPSAQEAADAAAPIFQAQRWRWTGHGVDRNIPTRADIYRTLMELAADREYGETGRLIHVNGQFGHERPPTPAHTELPLVKFSARREGIVPMTTKGAANE